MAQSVMQSLLESYLNGKNTLETWKSFTRKIWSRQWQPCRIIRKLWKMYLLEESTNNNSVFFYALVGMACLYGCFVGMDQRSGFRQM